MYTFVLMYPKVDFSSISSTFTGVDTNLFSCGPARARSSRKPRARTKICGPIVKIMKHVYIPYWSVIKCNQYDKFGHIFLFPTIYFMTNVVRQTLFKCLPNYPVGQLGPWECFFLLCLPLHSFSYLLYLFRY